MPNDALYEDGASTSRLVIVLKYRLFEKTLTQDEWTSDLRHKQKSSTSDNPLQVREKLDLARHLPFRMSQAARMFSMGASRTFQKQFGIGVREWRVIAILGDHGPVSAADMVGPAAFDKATVSRAISTLETNGFLTRRRDNNDGRKHLIYLTEKGVELHDRIVPLAKMRAKVIESALTARECTQFFVLLDKLNTQIKWLETEERDE